MKTKPGMHPLSARDDGWRMLLGAHNLVSHLCHILFLLLECNKTQAVSVSLAGFELMYWSWRSICSSALSPTGLGFSCLNSVTKIEKFDRFPFLGRQWLLCMSLRCEWQWPWIVWRRMPAEVWGLGKSGPTALHLGWKFLCVCNRLKTQITPARAPPSVLKMNWDHESWENSHIELQSFRAEELEVGEKAVRCWGRFSKALVKWHRDVPHQQFPYTSRMRSFSLWKKWRLCRVPGGPSRLACLLPSPLSWSACR